MFTGFASKKNVKYSIIIPTCNHLEDCLKPCVESILKTTEFDNVEVIIIANGCTDGTKDYVSSLNENFSIIWNDKLIGFSKAVNLGIKHSKGEYIILLNNDVIILDWGNNNRWIKQLEEPFLKDEQLAISGPKYAEIPPILYGYLEFWCAMIKKKIVEEIGFLDEIFTDADFCIRTQIKRYHIKTVENMSIYFDGKNISQSDYSNEISERNKKILVEKYGKIMPVNIPQSKNIEKIEAKDNKIEVTAEISTKDRYFETLPLCLNAIANQTYRPKYLMLFDDGEQKDLRNEPLYKHLFSLLQLKGIEWVVTFGQRMGQVANHQKAFETAKTSVIWRIDDDEIPEPTCLEKLVSCMDDKTGAVGGLVMDTNGKFPFDPLSCNKIEDIIILPNAQWHLHKDTNVKEVDHLYSSFIYRKEASPNGYCKNLSVVGHREETLFTMEIKRNGWKLLLNPLAITWHFQSPKGGIRTFQDTSLWEHDDQYFKEKMKEWGIIIKDSNDTKFIVLLNGLGDHFCFKKILPEVKQKYKNKRICIATSYPAVFDDEEGIQLIDISTAQAMLGDLEVYSVYRLMGLRNWKQNLVEAFREMYVNI